MATKKKLLQAAAGAAGGEALNVEDVFSTYLYKGNGSTTNTITNGIDLDGEGGLVWIKGRDLVSNPTFVDTERGTNKVLNSNLTAVQSTASTVKAFNSDGFTLSNNGNVNSNNYKYASWTFRKAPKFFDIQTFNGDGTSSQTISHNLGSTPGCIIVKNYSGSYGDSWMVYHRSNTSAPETDYLMLNSSNGSADNANRWNDTAPTDTEFTVGSTNNVSGHSYVAYIFAHNDGDGEFGPDSDQDIIKCGSYTGSAAFTDNLVNIGFEAQWILLKKAAASSNWFMIDRMSGFYYTGATTTAIYDETLKANSSDSTINSYDWINPEPRGFELRQNQLGMNTNGDDYIYIAIGRNTRVPEDADDVFGLNLYTGNGTAGRLIENSGSGIADMAYVAGTGSRIATRKTGYPYLQREATGAEISSNTRFQSWDTNEGFFVGNNSQVNSSPNTYLAAMWTEAPKYFNVVPYTGTGNLTQTKNHNLGVVPEMIWAKRRDGTAQWPVYHKDVGALSTLILNDNSSEQSASAYWRASPTNTEFYVGSSTGIGTSGGDYIAYLFASLDGVAKVGSYTGNGTSQTIDCGFTSGARYVLIKRSNAAGNWHEFNTEQGIVAGNDQAYYVNTGGYVATNPTYDIIDPHNSGFTINQETVSGSNLNVNGGQYIFYAIA